MILILSSFATANPIIENISISAGEYNLSRSNITVEFDVDHNGSPHYDYVSYEYWNGTAFQSDAVLYMPLTDDASDLSTYGNPGTAYNGVTYNASGAYMDGENNYIEIPSTYDSDYMSMSVWAKAYEDNPSTIFSFDSIYSARGWLQLSASQYKIRLKISGTSREYTASRTPDTEMHFYLLTYNGTNAILYDNMVPVINSAAHSGTLDSAAELDLGRTTSFGGLYWNGTIVNATYYNYSLSSEQGQILYAQQNILSSSRTKVGDVWRAKIYSHGSPNSTNYTSNITILDKTLTINFLDRYNNNTIDNFNVTITNGTIDTTIPNVDSGQNITDIQLLYGPGYDCDDVYFSSYMDGTSNVSDICDRSEVTISNLTGNVSGDIYSRMVYIPPTDNYTSNIYYTNHFANRTDKGWNMSIVMCVKLNSTGVFDPDVPVIGPMLLDQFFMSFSGGKIMKLHLDATDKRIYNYIYGCLDPSGIIKINYGPGIVNKTKCYGITFNHTSEISNQYKAYDNTGLINTSVCDNYDIDTPIGNLITSLESSLEPVYHGNYSIGPVKIWNRTLSDLEMKMACQEDTLLDLDDTDSNFTVTVVSNDYFDSVPPETFNAVGHGELDFVGLGAVLYLNISELITHNAIVSFNATVNKSSQEGAPLLLFELAPNDAYTINYNATGYNLPRFNISFYSSGRSNDTLTLNLTNSIINTTAINSVFGTAINTFTATLFHEDSSYSVTDSTTTGFIEFDVNTGNYTLVFHTTGYTNVTNTSEVTVANIYNVTFYPQEAYTLYLRIYDEPTRELLNGTRATLEIFSDVYSNNYTTSNGTLYATGLISGSYTVTYYGNESYTDQRYYYFDLPAGGSLTAPLYMLSTNLSQFTQLTLYDISYDPLNSYYMRLLRKYSNSGGAESYVTVDQSKTGFEGIGFFYTVPYDVTYRVQISDPDNNLIYTSSDFEVIGTSIELNIKTTQNNQYPYATVRGISSTKSFNENSNIVTVSFSDEFERDYTLSLYEMKDGQKTYIDSVSTTATSGVLTYNLSSYNASDTTISYVLSYNHNGEEIPINTGIVEYKTGFLLLGVVGVFLSFIIIITLAMSRTDSIKVSLMLLVLGFIGCGLFGFINVGAALSGLIIIGVPLITNKIKST